jgi:hypothetical protein
MKNLYRKADIHEQGSVMEAPCRVKKTEEPVNTTITNGTIVKRLHE